MLLLHCPSAIIYQVVCQGSSTSMLMQTESSIPKSFSLGIQVTLSGTDVDGNDVSAQMHTDLSGRYNSQTLKPELYGHSDQPRYLVDGGFVGGLSPAMVIRLVSHLDMVSQLVKLTLLRRSRSQSLSTTRLFNKPAEPTMVASFGDEIAESWIAIGRVVSVMTPK